MQRESQTIRVVSREAITVTNSQGKTLDYWTWDGRTLRHPRATWTATPQMAARLDAAVAEAVPSRTERLGGAAIAALPETGREGWEWDGDMDRGGGMYTRTVPGRAVTISYVPADFGK